MAKRRASRGHGRARPSGGDGGRQRSGRVRRPKPLLLGARPAALLALAEHASLALNHASALDEVAHEAFHDSLTGLPNRALFLDRLSFTRSAARAAAAIAVGVLFIDLDDFKTINDSSATARRRAARPGSRARLAGLPAPVGHDRPPRRRRVRGPARRDRRHRATRRAAASRVLDALADAVRRSRAARSSSAPASVSPPGQRDAETLLRDADLAMYRAKAEGKGRYQRVRAAHARRRSCERLELEVDLKRAIEADELELVYQPIFELQQRRDRRARGARALEPPDSRPARARAASSRSPRPAAGSPTSAAGSLPPRATRPRSGAPRIPHTRASRSA